MKSGITRCKIICFPLRKQELTNMFCKSIVFHVENVRMGAYTTIVTRTSIGSIVYNLQSVTCTPGTRDCVNT